MGLSSQLAPSAIAKPGVIANAAARPASPYDGQVIYQQDTDQAYVWNGSAWVLLSTGTANPPGLEYITETTFSAQTTCAIDNCFTTQYDSYRILWRQSNVSLTGTTLFRFRSGGSAIATNDYYYGGQVYTYNAASSSWQQGATSSVPFLISTGTTQPMATLEISNPRNSNRKNFLMSASHAYSTYIGSTTHGILNLTATNYDGFQFTQDAGGALSGTLTVYGYRKA